MSEELAIRFRQNCTATIFTRPKGSAVPSGPVIQFDEPPTTLTLAEMEFLVAKMREME